MAMDRTVRREGVVRAIARRGASMADVALAAGVSGQTVSRVANGRDNVDQLTRERVLAAMRDVGYRPNRAARALRNGQFHTIGVIMFELSSVGNMRTLDAISSAAAAAGYSVNLMPVPHPTRSDVSGAFNQLSEQSVDGVVILESHRLDEVDPDFSDRLPVVVVESNADLQYPIVDTDQAMGAQQATEHLLELGHRTVWHISGPKSSYSAQCREASWRATLRSHNRRVPQVLVGDWSPDSGYRLGAGLAGDSAVTAIFVANDQMALGVLGALHEAGRKVPQEVSVVGFDDMIEAANFWPPLTTVRQSFSEVGRRSVTALLREIQTGERQPGLDRVPTTFIARASTAPPPSVFAAPRGTRAVASNRRTG